MPGFSLYRCALAGSFVNNERSGKGVVKFVNGGSYEGVFARDRPVGKGVFTLPSSDKKYSSEWGTKHRVRFTKIAG